jgi:twitching motility protein PilT
MDDKSLEADERLWVINQGKTASASNPADKIGKMVGKPRIRVDVNDILDDSTDVENSERLAEKARDTQAGETAESIGRMIRNEESVDLTIPDDRKVLVTDQDASNVVISPVMQGDGDPDGDMVLASEDVEREDDLDDLSVTPDPVGTVDDDGSAADEPVVTDARPVREDDDADLHRDGHANDLESNADGMDADEDTMQADDAGTGEQASPSAADEHDAAVTDADSQDPVTDDRHDKTDDEDDHDSKVSTAAARDSIEDLESVDHLAMARLRDPATAALLPGDGIVSASELARIASNLEREAKMAAAPGDSGLPVPSDQSGYQIVADKMNMLIGPDDLGSEPFDVDSVLNDAIERHASDVHLTAGRPLKLRIYGSLYTFSKYRVMSSDDLSTFLTTPGNDLVEQDLITSLNRTKAADSSYVVKSGAHAGDRFRVHLGTVDQGDGVVFRHIRPEIFTPDEIDLTPDVLDWSDLSQGLILVTGPTGSGKSATLSTILRRIQLTKPVKIITLEEPIETMYPLDGMADVWQKEIPKDELTFGKGVRDAMREDPDVILIGEVRDADTIKAAMQACNTGHLTFATIHASSAPDVITRITDLAGEEYDHDQLRSDLARNLKGVLSQRLLLKADGNGRLAVREVIHVDRRQRLHVATGDVPSMARDLKMAGMDLDSRALVLALEGKTTLASARQVSSDREAFDDLCRALSPDAQRLLGPIR